MKSFSIESRIESIQKCEKEIKDIKIQQKDLKLKHKLLRNLINDLKNEVL
jgi:hypothetical protein